MTRQNCMYLPSPSSKSLSVQRGIHINGVHIYGNLTLAAALHRALASLCLVPKCDEGVAPFVTTPGETRSGHKGSDTGQDGRPPRTHPGSEPRSAAAGKAPRRPLRGPRLHEHRAQGVGRRARQEPQGLHCRAEVQRTRPKAFSGIAPGQ